ncbi:MAG: cytochrome c peroxidase [Planctomycetota bacterium]|nr:cytochrome c peroxidase [Planctomycetota bacterium]
MSDCMGTTVVFRTPLVALIACVLATSSALPAAAEEKAAEETPPLAVDFLPAQLLTDAVPAGLGPAPPAPEANQLSPSRVALGRKLFFDPLLSADRSMSCASCHHPRHGFATPQARAVGIKNRLGTRNTPTVLNRAYGKIFFWDGRSASLEAQALKPIENRVELGSSVPEVIQRLQESPEYRQDFEAAYPGGVTPTNLARALASFQRVLVSADSRVDRFQSGLASSLSTSQKQGLWLFESRGRCWKCHSGSNYSDESFHNTGVSWGKEPVDLGRYEVTREAADRGRFKTPTLRDVGLTAPYMHDGSMQTLEEVVAFYNRGGGKNPHLDQRIQPLGLNKQEEQFLVEFLKALQGATNWTAQTPAGKP